MHKVNSALLTEELSRVRHQARRKLCTGEPDRVLWTFRRDGH